MGVLAAIGSVAFRKHIAASRSIEAVSMIQSIAAAQERYRTETLTYLDVSTNLSTMYPMAAPDEKTVYDWVQAGHVNFASWQRLNVTVPGPVRYGYATVAGQAGADLSVQAVTNAATQPIWPTPAQTVEPWYVIQALGDIDGDGVNSVFVGSSFSESIYIENKAE